MMQDPVATQRRTRRILSIDGGGMRGVFSAAVIQQMEEKAGKDACEIFDCFVGTSAGSIIAAGLAAGKSAEYLKNIFIDVGRKMSEKMEGEEQEGRRRTDLTAEEMKLLEHMQERGLLLQKETGLSRAERASLALANILRPLFQDEHGRDKRAHDLKRRFAVVARNMELAKVVFFGNFPEDQLDTPSFWDDVKDGDTSVNEQDGPVWEMVLRSAALPPFFAPAGPYLDGGVSPFANPSYAAYVGVQRRLGWNPHKEALRFYSVGAGYHHVPQEVSGLDDTQLFSVMIDAMMLDINFLQHQIMKRRQEEGTIWYERYNISFDESGFKRYGLTVPDEATFKALASTLSPRVEELAKYGAVVGKALVGEDDFLDGPWLSNRREESEGHDRDRRVVHEAHDRTQRRRKDRRVMTSLTRHSADPSERAVSATG